MSTAADRPFEHETGASAPPDHGTAEPAAAAPTAAAPTTAAPTAETPTAGAPTVEAVPVHPAPPTEGAPPATARGADPAAPVPLPPPAGRLRPRTGPIVWGCLILSFCAYAAQRVLLPGEVDVALWVTATVLGLGALLLGVGIAIAIRSANRR